MNRTLIFIKNNQHIFVLFLFVLIYVLFFGVVIFNHKLLGPGDGFIESLANFTADKNAWTQNLYNGYPLQADPQVMAWYPVEVILNFFHLSFNVYEMLAFIFASFFTYLFSFKLTGYTLPSIASGIVFGFSGFMMGHLEHTIIIHTLAWLPLILLCVEILSQKFKIKWAILLSISYSCMELAGHPQMFLYCSFLIAAYACFKCIGKQNKFKFLIVTFAFIAIGVGLSAVELLPANQLSKFSARDSLNYENFIGFVETPKSLLSAFFPFVYGGNSILNIPYFGQWNFTELTFYVGSLTFLLVFIAIIHNHKNKQVIFWTLVAVISMLLALGPTIPYLQKFLYHVPIYNLFRAQSRHVAEFDFSISILTAFGMSFLMRTKLTRKQLFTPVIIVSFLFLSSFALLFLIRNKISDIAFNTTNIINYSILPWKSFNAAIPFIVFIVGICVFCLVVRLKSNYRNFVLLILILINMVSYAWFLPWNGSPPRESDLIVKPEVKSLNDNLIRNNSKILSLKGVYDDTFSSDIYGLLWNGQNSTGYSPLISQRYANLLYTKNDGLIDNSISLLDPKNQTLGILGINTISTRKNDSLSSNSFNIGLAKNNLNFENDFNEFGFMWSNSNANINIDSKANSSHLFIPNEYIDSIGLVSILANSCDISFGSNLGEIVINTQSDKKTFPLRMGIETTDPGCKLNNQDQRLQLFEQPKSQARYFTQFSIKSVVKGITIELDEKLLNKTTYLVDKIALKTQDNQFFSINPSVSGLYSSTWKSIATINGDEIFQNDIKPNRAWFVNNTSITRPDVALKAIRQSELNSSPFDYKNTALVENYMGDESYNPNSNSSIPIVTSPKQTLFNIQTNNENDSFLVLDQQYYPEWEATIDGQKTNMYQTDYVLMGIKVPKGKHSIIFNYAAKTTQIGMIISIVSFLILSIVSAICFLKFDHKQT